MTNFYFIKRIILILLVISGCSHPGRNESKTSEQPNILLIVADDLGYADLGCYGGDIETPNIDRLAEAGIRFSRFHTAPYCAPSRAMLLSGNDNHIAGIGAQGIVRDTFGYECRLTDRVTIIPEVLAEAGYHTYMAGKWHLGADSLSNPFTRGFERSFVNTGAAGNHYNNQGLFRSVPVTHFTENGIPVRWKDGNYSTDFFTDRLISYIGEQPDDGKPFFAYAAFTSPHWPLQVDEKYWRKYEGRYEAGYEKLKEERLESLKKAGMIPESAVLPPNHPSVMPWDSLSEDHKMIECRKMELYAGMVDNLDYNVGRLIEYLDIIGELENTIILFMSDNGAAAEDFYYDEQYGPFIREHFINTYENMGKPNSFVSYGPQWADAGSAPFRYFKSHVTEGGIVAPMIISGPGISGNGEISHELVTVQDIAPTFYELAGATYSDTSEMQRTYPLRGCSMVDILSGRCREIHDRDYIYGIEHNGRAMIRKGSWKIVQDNPPFRSDSFRLYDLSVDLAEIHDLRTTEEIKLEEMLSEWNKFRSEVKPFIPSPGEKE